MVATLVSACVYTSSAAARFRSILEASLHTASLKIGTYSIFDIIDPLQKPALLSYCCYVQQAMELSYYTCSRTVKNIAEQGENWLFKK